MRNEILLVSFLLLGASFAHAGLEHVEGGVQVDGDFGGVDRGIDGTSNNSNQLWGDFFLVDPANSFAQGDNLVHLEADGPTSKGPDPDSKAPGKDSGYTFYGRYTDPGSGADARETGDSTGIFNVDGLEPEVQKVEYRNGAEQRSPRKMPNRPKHLDINVERGKGGAKGADAGKSGGNADAKASEPGVIEKVADTAKGAVEGAGYLIGVHGSAADQTAARKASAKDITSGNARDRTLGAVDGYVNTATLGIADPNLSSYAGDQKQAQAGKTYGETGAVVAGVIAANPAQLAKNAARGGAQVMQQAAKGGMAGGAVVDTNAQN